MPYIGRQPLHGDFKKLDTITVVNGQAAYTMNHGGVAFAPPSANALIVSVNGVIQEAGSAYSVSQSTITFSENLVTGDVIDFIIVLGDTGSAVVPSADPRLRPGRPLAVQRWFCAWCNSKK